MLEIFCDVKRDNKIMYQCTSPVPRYGGGNIHSNLQSNNNSIITVDLYRDGFDAPWGFRLKGGIDVDGGTPLEVTKVGNQFTLL